MRGNERADQLAKAALVLDVLPINVPFSRTEAKSLIKSKVMEEWQAQWDRANTGGTCTQCKTKLGRGGLPEGVIRRGGLLRD